MSFVLLLSVVVLLSISFTLLFDQVEVHVRRKLSERRARRVTARVAALALAEDSKRQPMLAFQLPLFDLDTEDLPAPCGDASSCPPATNEREPPRLPSDRASPETRSPPVEANPEKKRKRSPERFAQGHDLKASYLRSGRSCRGRPSSIVPTSLRPAGQCLMEVT